MTESLPEYEGVTDAPFSHSDQPAAKAPKKRSSPRKPKSQEGATETPEARVESFSQEAAEEAKPKTRRSPRKPKAKVEPSESSEAAPITPAEIPSTREPKETQRLSRFEYAPTPNLAEEWNPGMGKDNADQNVYTGLPDPSKKPEPEVTPSFYRPPQVAHMRNRGHGGPKMRQPHPRHEAPAPDEQTPREEPEQRNPQQAHPRQEQGRQDQGRHAHPQNRHPQQQRQRHQGQQQHAQQGQRQQQAPQQRGQHPQQRSNPQQPQQQKRQDQQRKKVAKPMFWSADPRDIAIATPSFDSLCQSQELNSAEFRQTALEGLNWEKALDFNHFYKLPLHALYEALKALNITVHGHDTRAHMLQKLYEYASQEKLALRITGLLEVQEEGYGVLLYDNDSYAQKPINAFLPKGLVDSIHIGTGHILTCIAQAPRENESSPVVLRVESIMGETAERIATLTPFHELTPYYPLNRILLECPQATWDNLSMRIIDLLCPIGLGQRGLIVAPPRVGKTVLLQAIAHAIAQNTPEAHLMVVLIDERPEEVTDFRRHVKGEVVASTFDQSPESHVHLAEMAIAKARRMVECGQHVVILLDSITRLARAYNALMPTTGKILSGGVESNALERPKRFFGSARNIEGGGSLTILGTTLIDTGSKMDEVIFEEFKGTGNMELHLDRGLADKRIFPALNIEKSGTRKEELLYHSDELSKIYALRRAMKGLPVPEAMEMVIQRVKKTKTNAEFLLSLGR
jgi:transcription termination factor Rho